MLSKIGHQITARKIVIKNRKQTALKVIIIIIIIILLLLLLLLVCALILSFHGQQEKTMFIYLQKLTDLTVLSFKSWSTHTAVSFVCKTGLTSCSVLAKVLHAFVLGWKHLRDESNLR